MIAVEDQRTFVLRHHAELDPIGVLVYKTELQVEYALDGAFKIKTFGLFSPACDSGKSYGDGLLGVMWIVAQTARCHSERRWTCRGWVLC